MHLRDRMHLKYKNLKDSTWFESTVDWYGVEKCLNLNLSHAWIDPYQYFDIFQLHLENLSFIGIKWGNPIYFIQEIIVNLSNPWTSGEPMIVWMPNQIVKGIILILLNWYTSQCAACWLYNIQKDIFYAWY